MKTHMWLMHAAIRTSGLVRSTPGKPVTGTVRAWAACGILGLAIVLGSLSAVAAGHHSAGHANAHQPATHTLAVAIHPNMPWMY
jgi:hypothetical protein